MANERTLFQKLIEPEERLGRSSRERREQLAESVVRHLSRLLNSRQGCALTVDDYGMPEFNDSVGSRREMQITLENAIRATIQKYEPRLRRVSVRMEEDDGPRLTPRFTVLAELATTDDTQRQVSFATVMGPNGQLMIS